MNSALLVASSLFLATSAQAQWSHYVINDSLPDDVTRTLDSADFDGDGDLDVLVGGRQTGTLLWLENTGIGSQWISHRVLPASIFWINTASAGDLDGDGDVDVLYSGGDKTRWIENDGDGTFSTERTLQFAITSHRNLVSSDLGDVDGDGDLDLIAGVLPIRNFLFVNTGGILRAGDSFGNYGSTPMFRDLDGDGDLDIVEAGRSTVTGSYCAAYLNDGSGQMTPYAVNLDAASYAQFVDFDSDGDLDFLRISSSRVQWREKLAGGQFGALTTLIEPLTNGLIFVTGSHLGDFDGDGIDELLLQIRFTGGPITDAQISWYDIPGDGTLGSAVRVDYVSGVGMKAVDADGDGDLDVFSNDGERDEIFLHVSERTLGVSECSGEVNSTGARGRLRLTGSDVAQLNSCQVSASELPAHQVGFFLVSSSSMPPAPVVGSTGTLCLDGQIGRVYDSVQSSGAAGRADYDLDLTEIPTPAGTESIVAGMTRYFSFWHRDVGTSNITETVQVLFR